MQRTRLIVLGLSLLRCCLFPLATTNRRYEYPQRKEPLKSPTGAINRDLLFVTDEGEKMQTPVLIRICSDPTKNIFTIVRAASKRGVQSACASSVALSMGLRCWRGSLAVCHFESRSDRTEGLVASEKSEIADSTDLFEGLVSDNARCLFCSRQQKNIQTTMTFVISSARHPSHFALSVFCSSIAAGSSFISRKCISISNAEQSFFFISKDFVLIRLVLPMKRKPHKERYQY